MSLSERVAAWRDRGERQAFRDREIHVFTRTGREPLLLYLHGFPSSSYDWRLLLDEEPAHAAIAFDFLGFGLSEKPREHTYTLGWQADLAEEIVHRHGAERAVFIVAHDMGTSVATELMARDIEGDLEMPVAGALLFNGSMILRLSSPTPTQRMLRSRLGPLFARLASERFFRHQFGSVFSAGHPLSDEEAADQWSLITHNGGHRLGHKLVHYMDEREIYAERWHGAIRDWKGPLHLSWGMLDPVATPRVLDGLRDLRPAVGVAELPDLGHYPQIEDPPAIAGALREALSASL